MVMKHIVLFIRKVKSAFNKHFPLTKLSGNRMKDTKLITSGLKKCSRQNSKLYKDWINKRTIESENKYKTYKKLINKVSRDAEALYYKELFSSQSNSTKQLWNNLNMVCSLKPKIN